MEGDFRIDQWLVHPRPNAMVLPDNATLQLELEVMEVPVCLTDCAGEAVSKESLLRSTLDRLCWRSCWATVYGEYNVRD